MHFIPNCRQSGQRWQGSRCVAVGRCLTRVEPTIKVWSDVHGGSGVNSWFDLNCVGATKITAKPRSRSNLNLVQAWSTLVKRALSRESVSRPRVKLCLVSVFPDIVKDCCKMRNLLEIFLRSFETVGPASCLWSHRVSVIVKCCVCWYISVSSSFVHCWATLSQLHWYRCTVNELCLLWQTQLTETANVMVLWLL